MTHAQSGSSSLSEPLTQREREILVCLADGLSNQEIANKLFLAEKTVRWYNSQIYRKLDVSSRQEAVRLDADVGVSHHPTWNTFVHWQT